MVGFPLEDRHAFANTRDLVSDLPLTYLHVFAFSPREGTPASGLADEVGPEEKKARSLALRTLGAEKSQAFRQSLIGEVLETLVLGGLAAKSSTGLSGNYVKVFLDSQMETNSLVRARVTAARGGGVEARFDSGQEQGVP
jgi:threonylcarbamoyladenosine tRNA methylthiotransferase MtaB